MSGAVQLKTKGLTGREDFGLLGNAARHGQRGEYRNRPQRSGAWAPASLTVRFAAAKIQYHLVLRAFNTYLCTVEDR